MVVWFCGRRSTGVTTGPVLVRAATLGVIGVRLTPLAAAALRWGWRLLLSPPAGILAAAALVMVGRVVMGISDGPWCCRRFCCCWFRSRNPSGGRVCVCVPLLGNGLGVLGVKSVVLDPPFAVRARLPLFSSWRRADGRLLEVLFGSLMVFRERMLVVVVACGGAHMH
jgi:hypothetical protein